MAAERGRRAAFLDRDGTIIRDVNYLSRPEQVQLLPGAAAALRRLNEAGAPVIVVTNQSGIARDLLTLADYESVRARLDELLAREGARVDATYVCPHHPDFTGPCACRKPGTLLYRQACAEHGLDPAHSLFVGDRWRDVAPGLALGLALRGRAILVPNASTPPDEVARARHEAEVAGSLAEAVERFLGG